MHTLNGLYVKQMVEAIQLERESEYAQIYQLAELPRTGPAATVRRWIGASFIGAGKLIQGSPKTEATAEPST